MNPPCTRRSLARWWFAAAVLCAAPDVLAATSSGKLNFNRDVRPILSDKCFQCHGPDEKKREGNLRLDDREAALKGGDGGPAFVPGQPDKSELVTRILSKDRDEQMPPPKSHKTLDDAQIATLKQWIAEGAEYQGHWAFLKPERPEVPAMADLRLPLTDWEARRAAWEQNPIDAFVVKKLAEHSLAPAAEAEPETLIRRMTLDLTGLPPTPEEVDAFVRSYRSTDSIANRQSAIGNLADRLLASPRYGEKMAQQWLDFARYADSNGFQSDTSRAMWPWREWLINAYNRNEPFDKFTIDQLAGDLVPNATRDQIVATGFNRNHRLNGEGGRIVEEWFAETVIDRVETTGLTWLALTLNCCRCHDHKYDPISQKEFYQLFAFFNSNDESGVLEEFGGAGRTRAGGNSRPLLFLPSDEEAAQQAKLEATVKTAEQALPEARKQMAAAQSAWELSLAQKLAAAESPWRAVEATEAKSMGGATLTRQADGSWLAGGTNPANDTYEITAPATAGKLTGLQLEVLPDATLPNQSLGRGHNGNFVLTAVEVDITVPGKSDPLVAEFTRAEADYEQKGWAVAGLVADQPKMEKGKRAKRPTAKGGWAIDGNDPTKRLPRKAIFVCKPLDVPEGATLTVRLVHGSGFGDHNVGRFRVSTTSTPAELVSLKGTTISPDVIAALKVDAAKRSAPQKQALAKFFAESNENPVKRAEATLADARKKLDDFMKTLPSVMVMKERAEPRDAFILKRGEYDKPGDKVPRGVPAALPPLPAGAPLNRLGFAQWLVSGEHPLTARVWVNRAWEKFFGTGFVRTSENLGSQAEWPSHPELLDWLATEFVRVGWDMKAIQRLIVTSATYRQSSRVTPELLAKDPENRLLSRGPRLRLGAETLRDQALAVSGLLVEKIGGPSVRPYMPPAVWDETSKYGDLRNYMPDTGEGLYRRTLYTIWKRTAAPPSLQLFDAPTREICTVKRSRTNTPLQALALLNEVTYVEAARALAQRMLKEGGATPEERIAWAFRRATGVAPHADELRVLKTGLEKRLARFRNTPDEAKQLLTVGASKPDPQLDPIELAAYSVTGNVLLNLDRVITRE